MHYDALIVGAGFAGSVCAERLAAAGKTVLVIDQRSHFGGNAYDRLDEHGVLVHPYGPHIFHTNSKRVLEYLSQFTTWRFYEHRVLAEVDGALLPIPINLTTLNRLYGASMSSEEAGAFLERARVPISQIRTSEDVVLSSVGNDLCEKFFRGYTRKQWGLDLSELSAGVAARIPTRTDTDDRYFTDTYQMMPANGYAALFGNLLANPRIQVRLDTSFDDIRHRISYDHLVFTGRIDAFFGFRHGTLPYRSLHFEHEHFPDRPTYQPTGTVNYPNTREYTRTTEFKYLTGQVHRGTSIVREYPLSEGDPYYPIPRPANEKMYKLYRALADERSGVTFVGRLAEYKYYNMDQVVASALAAAGRLLGERA